MGPVYLLSSTNTPCPPPQGPPDGDVADGFMSSGMLTSWEWWYPHPLTGVLIFPLVSLPVSLSSHQCPHPPTDVPTIPLLSRDTQCWVSSGCYSPRGVFLGVTPSPDTHYPTELHEPAPGQDEAAQPI